MNDQRLSMALDALTQLQESLRDHRDPVKGIAPIDGWLNLVSSAKRNVENTAIDPKGRVTKLDPAARKRSAG